MPGSQYAIGWHVDPRYARIVKRRSLAVLARKALGAERVPATSALSIAVVDDRTVRGLNRRFRGVDAATDVLSFALASSEEPDAGDGLGEVVIAFPTARKQAMKAGLPVHDELSHLLVHGVLHILGYDHESARDARKMRAREEELLGRAIH